MPTTPVLPARRPLADRTLLALTAKAWPWPDDPLDRCVDVLACVETFPENYDQGDWVRAIWRGESVRSCGTAMCIGGWTEYRGAGDSPFRQWNWDYNRAADALGLAPWRFDVPHPFSAVNSLTEVYGLIAEQHGLTVEALVARVRLLRSERGWL
jgi:hypothetical protein